MSQITIQSAKFSGSIIAPPSKSLSHRVMIAAALSAGVSEIYGIRESVDIRATKLCLETIGANIKLEDNTMTVQGVGKPESLTDTTMFCEESGSTLRFMIPIAALTGQFISFDGKGKLKTRPIDPYFDIFERSDIQYEYDNKLPLKIRGGLKSGIYEMPGHISSQFVTGLLMALPLLTGNSELIMTTKLESRDYVDLTLQVLASFGIEIINHNYEKFEIQGNQNYKSQNMKIEGDYSQMAFWAVAGVIGNDPIVIENATVDSKQGDARIFDILKEMGGRIEVDGETLTVFPSKTKNIRIDASEIPDLVPILAVLGTFSEGTMEIYGAERVRLKESDRLAAIACELNKVGGAVVETEDGIKITGVNQLGGGTVDGWNDHRIVMAMSVAAIRCSSQLTIDGWEAINKSYPDFYRDYQKLGGVVNERDMG